MTATDNLKLTKPQESLLRWIAEEFERSGRACSVRNSIPGQRLTNMGLIAYPNQRPWHEREITAAGWAWLAAHPA